MNEICPQEVLTSPQFQASSTVQSLVSLPAVTVVCLRKAHEAGNIIKHIGAVLEPITDTIYHVAKESQLVQSVASGATGSLAGLRLIPACTTFPASWLFNVHIYHM